MGQIAGNTPVKPCALFCGACYISCIDGTKRTVNACMGAVLQQGKIKALHPQQMQGKRKAPPAWAELRILLVPFN